MPVLSAEELDQKLAEIVRRLCDAFSPVAIYLFGSYAYGTPQSHSDIDLLVVVEDSPLDPYGRDALAYHAIGSIGRRNACGRTLAIGRSPRPCSVVDHVWVTPPLHLV